MTAHRTTRVETALPLMDSDERAARAAERETT